ncbi:ABC transporter permease [bacterium]|nr:ABC transporter permease [bacterium]
MSANVAPAIGYRSTTRVRFGQLRAIWAIARSNLRVIFRYWFFWVLIAIAMLHFLITFALIYLKSQMAVSDELGFASALIDQIQVTGSGRAYMEFLLRQTEGVYITLAYASAVLLATDFQAGGINFYLSKPIGRLQYLLGKLIALFVVVGIQTLVPALALFVEAALYAENFTYVSDHTHILIGIFAYSAVIMIVPSVLGLAIAVTFRKTAPIIVVWIGFLFIIPAFGALLRAVFDNGNWMMLGLRYDLRVLGGALFSIISPAGEMRLPYVLVIVVAISVLSVALVIRQLKPVEVVQ